MNFLKYTVTAAALSIATAALAASDGSPTNNGTSAAGSQPGATSEQSDRIPSKLNEGRAAKTNPTNSPQNAPTGTGASPGMVGTPAGPNVQGN
jgi:hypothetical protein